MSKARREQQSKNELVVMKYLADNPHSNIEYDDIYATGLRNEAYPAINNLLKQGLVYRNWSIILEPSVSPKDYAVEYSMGSVLIYGGPGAEDIDIEDVTVIKVCLYELTEKGKEELRKRIGDVA